jgi:small subunit ribosomal protein S6
MRRYESVVILDPDLTDDDIRQFTERYTALIKNNNGETIKVEDWGKKKLAYLVKKREMGRYILFDYVASAEVIIEVERNFKIDEEVIKYLSVKLDDDVDLEAFKAKAEEEAKAKAESEAPPEETPTTEVPTTEAPPAETPPAEAKEEQPAQPAETAEAAPEPAPSEEPKEEVPAAQPTEDDKSNKEEKSE